MKNQVAIKALCKHLGYQFKNPGRLQEALTHRSKGLPNNERLEFLGDAVLSLVVAEALLTSFPAEPEGRLSRMRAALVKGETLTELAQTLNLGEVLILGPGELRSGGHRRASTLADTLEALFGAIYLDGGLEAVKSVILNLYQDKIFDPEFHETTRDHKTLLQEHLQASKLPLPQYELIALKGAQHDQSFEVACRIPTLPHVTQGEGPTRRKAEQRAAQAMIKQLK